MKTRTGFVSNSSSSSFIVAVKRVSEKCPHCGRGTTNFLDEVALASGNFSDTCISDRGSVDVAVLLFATTVSDESPEKKQEIRDKLKKYDSPEWELACIDLSYHDNVINSRFSEECRSGNVVQILNMENI